jgi:hypothetical protein
VNKHTSERLYCLRELNAMTWADWVSIPVTRVSVDNLVPTQSCVVIDRLIDLNTGGKREGGDPYGHVIEFEGQRYIHDGHHDVIMRWLWNETSIPVRFKAIDVKCVDPCCYAP